MARRKLQEIKVAEWPRLDEQALNERQRALYRARSQAVQAYAAGTPVEEVCMSYGIHHSTLIRMVWRAEMAHADGRPWGFRAFVPHVHVRPYERRQPPKVLEHKQSGNAGAFSQLLSRYPALQVQLRREIRDARVTLQGSSNGSRLRGVKNVLKRFLQACRDLGIGPSDYPFNQKDHGSRSLARILNGWIYESFAGAAKASGARFKPASALRGLPERGIDEAFDTVEFDAHKLDVRLKIIDKDPLGNEQVFEIERIWLLAIIDVATRCILGSTLVLQREYTRYDVIATIANALEPMTIPHLNLPGLALAPAGGFVSQALPETHWTCWRQIRLDNAKAHLAAISLDVLCDGLGCIADFGPAYEPDDRPFIERFFGTLTQTLSRRLPSGIPLHPVAASKRRPDPNETLRLMVTPEEMEELLAVTIWNYHAEPHSSLGGMTPLERMRTFVDGIGRPKQQMRKLPMELRGNLYLLQSPYLCRVQGSVARGERPYVSFFHVRYTSIRLASRPNLIGQHIRIYYDAKNITRIWAFTEDGHPLDDLWASGPWRNTPHSLRVRQQFFRAKRAKQLNFVEGQNPIEAFLNLRRTQAKKSKRAATDLAQSQQTKRLSQATLTSAEAFVVDAKNQREALPVRGKDLRIARGFSR